jgi:hypothetical protein
VGCRTLDQPLARSYGSQMTIKPARYVFVREFGSRHGELHRERAGFVKIVGRAYLNREGWLMHSGGSWLAPGRFSVHVAPPAKVSVPLARIVTNAMRHAQVLLGDRYHSGPPIKFREPIHSSERDSRHHHSV